MEKTKSKSNAFFSSVLRLVSVRGGGNDMHGAGAVQFDTKAEDDPLGEGGERFYNYVRLVRDVNN